MNVDQITVGQRVRCNIPRDPNGDTRDCHNVYGAVLDREILRGSLWQDDQQAIPVQLDERDRPTVIHATNLSPVTINLRFDQCM